ncbi:hypothetical protein HNY42_13735 [Exiguobacterium sp. Helios]|uniref:hypothetical protein n=1 Tax=Exiguobacterium sp. Helios TaxID=2735868 RepID=UPI00165E4AE5|nr:hypothetical protein [Exiguobacterium sp. Helios]QNR21957.1 hypothetical protein HNY42_13735 [Exiguobacterium sp. Helios]
MQKEYTISQAVNKYGTSKQKQSFELKLEKGDRNLNVNVLESILKVIETHYEEVKVEGRGSKRIIICNHKREIPLVKQDNRRNNGKWTVPYTANIDVQIIKIVKEGICLERPRTLTDWSHYFGLINSKELNLFRSKFDTHRYDLLIKDLISSSTLQIGEEKVIDDFSSYLLMIRDQVHSSLKRLKKINALDILEIFNGKTSTTNKSILISKDTYNKVEELKAKLMKEFDITNFNLVVHSKAKKVIAYKKSLADNIKKIKDENGTVLNLEYVFMTYELSAFPNKDLLSVFYRKYPDKVSMLDIKDEQEFWQKNYESYLFNRKKYINNSAEKTRQRYFIKKMHGPAYPELGGKGRVRGPQLRDFKYDILYHTLFFEDDFLPRINALSNYFITK